MPDEDRHLHRWGFADTSLELDGPRSVRMTGNRYPLSGHSMPHLIPFVEQMLGVPFEPSARLVETTPSVPPPVLDAAVNAALDRAIPAERRSTEPRTRLAHSHGQLSIGEVDRVLYQGGLDRVVDVVVEPINEDEIRALVSVAEHGVCLVPFGGGTNVSGALTCPAGETRTIVSIDMRRMRRVIAIDRQNNAALVEAGITGAELEDALGAQGYTCGHTPDSFEFSTLGGWIATHASGMKKNRYGNIEDVVIEASLVTPAGVIETRRPAARTSTGIQPLSLLFGSEGNLGVITKALIAIHPRPAVCHYGSLLFRSFSSGLAFLQQVRAEAGALPASIRLVNNREFLFGQALRPAAHGARALVGAMQRRWLFDVLHVDPAQMAACTIVMEGSREEVARQERTLRRLGRRFRAVWAGAENGRRGYSLTFAIAYLRDFFSQYGIVAESFETSVPWDRVEGLCDAVERALVSECTARQVPGKPYLSYRATQTYHAGVCLYFTMAFQGRGLVHPGGVFHEVEQALRQVVLDHGGSLSHHHGIGKIRQRFLSQVHSPTGLEAIRAVKRSVDPGNVFGIGNGACSG